MLPAIITLIVGTAMAKKRTEKKRAYNKVLMAAPQPDMRTECPKCKLKEKRPLKKTEKFTISGKPHRRGYYLCECGQWFARLLSD